HSPLAQNLAELLRQAAEDVRVEAMQQMNGRPVRRAAAGAAPGSINAMTTSQTGDILKLATQNDDLSVQQLAAQATRIAPGATPGAPTGSGPVELQPHAS